MSLWEPGTIEGITPAVISAVAARAVKDHAPRVCQCADPVPDPGLGENRCAVCFDVIGTDPYGCNIAPDEIPITDIHSPEGDRAFDRVSFAYHRGETVTVQGVTFVIGNYASRWTLHRLSPDPATDERIRLGESELAALLTAENGPHPNPHVAIVEVQYSTRGYRAGYGIRRDGTAELFYN